jgi:site-specific DNA recombinase
MKRLALYARVSGDKQEREETIDSQLAHLSQLAAEKGLTVLDRHVYIDEAYSGDLLARPGLDRLRDDARDGLVDVVLVHCPDRLARRYAYQVVVTEELQKYGCQIDFVNREIAQTPEDRMLLAMQGVIAEYERAKIAERTRRGRLYRLQTGVLIAPQPPYGYRWVARQGAERGRIEIVPAQAELVRQIYGWVADEGLTILAVTTRLFRSGIHTPRGGIRWGSSTIQKMLRNRAYIGEFCFNRIMAVEAKTLPRPGVYRRKRLTSARRRPSSEWVVVPGPAIINGELFAAVQKRLAENKRFALRHAPEENHLLLRCLLHCGYCGYSLMGERRRPHPHRPNSAGFRYYCYRCIKHADHTRYGDCVTRCILPPLKADLLDEVVWNDLRTVMSDPARIARHAGLEQDTTSQPLKAEVERLMREIQSCDRQTQRLVDAYQRGAVEMEDLLLRRKQIDGRKVVLTDAIKQAEAALRDDQARRDISAQLPDFVRHVSASLESADFHTRQRLVRLLIDRVVIQPDLDVEIHYALGPLRRVGDAESNQAGKRGPAAGDRPLSSDLRLHSHLHEGVAHPRTGQGLEEQAVLAVPNRFLQRTFRDVVVEGSARLS